MPITVMIMLVLRMMMIFLKRKTRVLSYLASFLNVQLLVGDKEDAVADVEGKDCRLQADL